MKTIIKRSYSRVGWRCVICPDGVLRRLVLEVDSGELLDQLGDKAIHNKSGRAQLAQGALRVRLEEL